ncbi:MAG: hypothetical protein U0359_10035 [Byssovorax sp.]
MPNGAACTGLLLGHPGTCENDPVERTKQYTAREEARAGKLTAEGPPVVGQLSSFPGVNFNVARGRCFAMIVRFGDGARMGDVTPNEQMRTREETVSGSSMAQPSTPGLPSNLYCPRSPGELSFWFQDRWSYARTRAAGQGEVSVQLYSTPISEADLKAGDEKQAAIDRKIDSMPAGCDDCDYDCRAAGTACEHRCFVDTAGGAGAGRDLCNATCAQITRACQAGCEARCR